MFKLFKKKKSSKSLADNESDAISSLEEDKKKDASKDYKVEVEKSVKIYTMPEKFRDAHKQTSSAQKTGLLILIGGVIFLVIISVGIYYYLFKEKPKDTKSPATVTDIQPEESVQPEEPTFTPPEEEPVEIKNPRESYLEMRAEFDKVTNLDELYEMSVRFGSKNKVEEFENKKEEINNLPDSSREDTFSVLLGNIPKLDEIGSIDVEEDENTATLNVVSKDLSQKGFVEMVLEDNIWKLESESWKEEQAVIVVGLISGLDSDNDGLSDKEESLLDSDLNNVDSDDDGYNDLLEVTGLYNPAGAGTLIDRADILQYTNNTHNYKLIYPTSWAISDVGGDDSIMLRSDDNHFIQIITQANVNKESIENWFMSQFNVVNIDNSLKTEAESWQGIKNEDNLTIYLTDTEKNSLYTITYNPGNSNTIEYKNILNMIIKSFEVSN